MFKLNDIIRAYHEPSGSHIILRIVAIDSDGISEGRRPGPKYYWKMVVPLNTKSYLDEGYFYMDGGTKFHVLYNFDVELQKIIGSQ